MGIKYINILRILCEISFLEYCHGFKELNHLILSVNENSFEWIDVKIVTAKL